MTYKEILIRLIKEYKKVVGNLRFFTIIIVGIIVTTLNSIEPFFAAKAISYIESYLKGDILDFSGAFYLFLIWGIFVLTNPFLRYIYRYYCFATNSLDYYIKKAKRHSSEILKMTEFEFLNNKGGALFKKFDRGVDAHFDLLFNIITEVFPSIVMIIFITIFLSFINPILTVITLSCVPIFLFMGLFFNKSTAKLQEKINTVWEDVFGVIGDSLTNLTLVKTLTIEKKKINEINNGLDNVVKNQLVISKRWGIADTYVAFLINLSKFIVILAGIYMIKNHNLELGTLFLFFSYISYIYYPLNTIFIQIRNIQRHLESIKKFNNLFDTMSQDEDSQNAKNIENIIGNIEFKNVDFSYISGKKVLDNINFKVKKGERIALVGSTGSGKSTISKLLLKLFDIDSGEILIDGNSIENIKKESLRQNIGIVMQDSSLFNTTIRENLKLVKEDITEDEMRKILKEAKADFVFKTEKGLETIIGERGLKLSGGEKQRLNIARILIKNPEILILDEATSALDNKTEIEIQNSLNKLMQGKTSLIIAHRLSTIKNVDRILVLDNGKIVEVGDYEELINKKGHFYSLANPDKLMIS